VVTGDSVERRKPQPDPYLAGLKGIGNGLKGESVAVENAPAGIESAKRAGLKCIAITTTLSDEQLRDADLIVRHHHELADIILR